MTQRSNTNDEERGEKVMKPFIEEEGDAEIEAVKRVLTDRSGLNLDTN